MQLPPLLIPVPLTPSLLGRVSSWPRPRCCCYCCRHTAVRTAYERRQNGWQHAKLQATVIGCLHDPANVQQTSSISMCILNTFSGSLLDVCWIV